MSKISILILILLFLSNCSNDKKQGFFSKNKSKVEKIEKVQTILTKQERKEREFNPTLKIKVSNGKYNKNFHNNQNDVGELSYKGELKKKGKYKFSKFDNFENIDVQPVFYNENVIFSDNKGKIILYNENQKKNLEKKLL